MNNIKFFIFLLLSGTYYFVRAFCPSSCVCYLDHEPRKIICSQRGLDEFPSNISDLVEHLDVSKNNLKTIGSDIGRLIEVRYLNLAKNQLIGLPGEIGELWKLERLDLSENNIEGVGESIAAITRLPNLRILYLSQNPLTGIHELSNVALRSLDVSGCTISRMTNESLEGMPELISLNIQDNPITLLQRIKSDKLKWLDMSNCRLNILASNTFEDLPGLEQLRLANNPNLVYSTRKETLRHEKLKRFDASGCNLDRPGLHGLPSLTQAILSRNVIRFLPDKIFSRNKMLMYLALDGNGLNQVNGSSFDGMPALETLDLSSNSLVHLPPGLFKDSTNMRLLNLSNNDIKLLPNNLTLSATTLDLSINLIEHVDGNNIKNMPRIRNLNLAKNRLISFAAGLESQTLKTLSLEGNRISKLTNKSFTNLPSLVGIDLSGNRLTDSFSCDIFSLNNHLQKILLDDNPWRCDCEQLHSMYLYLTRSALTNSSSLICQSPSNVAGYSWSMACQTEWSTDTTSKVTIKDKLYQLGLMGIFICLLIFGTVVSIGHTVRTKRRQALLRIREAERAEARERLILHRRTMEIEARHQQHQPRIHPEEIIGPPTYEEAVQLPRLARSLDRLDSLSTEGIGNSGQSITDPDAWARKRRMQSRKRINKRARSEDHLNSRSEVDRMRQSSRFFKDRSMSVPRRDSSVNRSKINLTAEIAISSSSSRQKARLMTSDSDEQPASGGSSCLDGIQSRGVTRSRSSIASKKKRRLLMRKNEHSSDDEDSDNRGQIAARSMQNLRVIALPREPRSGTYRPFHATTLSQQQQQYHHHPGGPDDAAEYKIIKSHIV